MCCSPYQIIIKIKYAKILKKPNGSREIKKNTTEKIPKNTPKWPPRKEDLL